MTLNLSRNATPKAKYFFNRMQILSSVALSAQPWGNDAQKPMGLIMMSWSSFGFSRPSMYPLGCPQLMPQPIALGTASGGWRINSTVGSKIYGLRSVTPSALRLPGRRYPWGVFA